ncbi:MAG: PD-(D/E)XK nuclease family protein [Elusimicrobia bacterium]|nr:PD-(D/E)XK nuclease family protein [Elusimicrobiota bacterium]
MAEGLQPLYKVDLVVEGNSHLYDVAWNGGQDRYPGVTGMLSVINKPALVPWAKREALSLVEAALMTRLDGRRSARIVLNKAWISSVLIEAKKRPDKLKTEAADLGSQAHAFIDRIIRGEEPGKVPPEIEAPVRAFRDWWKSTKIELLLGDTKVASREHKFGGSLDALGRRNGKLVILDWKTSNGIYAEYALQVAAYAQAFKETYGIACDEAVIVRFGKKLPVDFERKEIADLNRSFEAFLAAKALKESLEQPQFIEW